MNLTPRQYDVLAAIQAHRDIRGASPSFRELADSLGLDPVTVWDHAQALKAKRMVYSNGHQYRSLELVNPRDVQRNAMVLPVLGSID